MSTPLELVECIRSEAAIAERAGQFGRLEAIAEDVSRLIAEAEERGRRAAEARYADIWEEGAEAGDHDSLYGEETPNPYR